MAVRILAQAAVSFLLGIVAARYGRLWGYGLWAAWLSAVGWMAVRCCRPKAAFGRMEQFLPVLLRVWLCLTMCILGSVRYTGQQQTIERVEQYLSEQSDVTVVGTLHKKEEKNQKVSYYLKNSYIICETGALSGGQILIYSETDDFSIGDTISVTGKGECFEGARNQGNFDARSYYHSKNVLFRLWAEELTLVKRPAFLWREKLYQLRRAMQQVFAEKLPQEAAGVLGVMTLGEKGLLEEEVKKLYQQSGISHVLAISGLHVSILGAGVYQFLRKRGLSYLWSGFLAGALVLCFGQLSGMELSTARAVTMFLVMLLGNVLGMAYDSVTALAFSALLQLWANPLCLWYAGFILSYGAVLAVVVAVRILENAFAERKKKQQEYRLAHEKSWKGRMIRWKREMKSTFFVSTCIQLVVLPLTVYYYYEFPLYTVVINGLLLPFMGTILMSGILGGLTGVFGGMFSGPAGTVLEALSFLLLRPAYFLLEWNKQICNLFGRLPGAMQITGQPGMGMMVVYFTVLALALWWLNRRRSRAEEMENKNGNGTGGMEKFKTGLHWTEKKIVRAVPGILPLVAVIIALVILVCYRPNPGLAVCFLDVGQGDGIYIQAESGSFFIDGGSTSEKQVGEYRILSFLKCRGVRKVDGWFVSHGDEDHISGLKEVWESGYSIENLFLSRWIPRDEAWQELCRLAGQYGTEVVYLNAGDVVGSGVLSFTCLYPWEEVAERNDASLALHMNSPNLTAFFGGDLSTGAEKKLAERYENGPVDLYKALHHGSDGSNCETLLSLLRPAVSVVSCAAKNSYGHPGEYAMERIEAQGSRIFYTMEGGQITVGADEKGVWVEEFVGKK